MIDRNHQSEACRRDQIRTSTDPQWVREQYGEHQFSTRFLIVAYSVLALACYGIFSAIAAI